MEIICKLIIFIELSYEIRWKSIFVFFFLKKLIEINVGFCFVSCIKEKGSGESEHINLKVLGQDNAVVQFKIKKHTPLRKLMNAYCDRAVSTKLFFLLLTFLIIYFHRKKVRCTHIFLFTSNWSQTSNLQSLGFHFVLQFSSRLQKGLSMQVVRFRFDGQAINENDTPTSLEMEEGDTIEVYQQQTGGAQ